MNVESRITDPREGLECEIEVNGGAEAHPGGGLPPDRDAIVDLARNSDKSDYQAEATSVSQGFHEPEGDDQVNGEPEVDDHEMVERDQTTKRGSAKWARAADRRSLRRSTRSRGPQSTFEKMGEGTLSARDAKLCRQLLGVIKRHSSSWPFATPVDPVASAAPGYFDIIKHPMDLSTIQSKLRMNHYNTPDDVIADIRLMLDNCFTYNPPSNHIYQHGKSLERHAELHISKLLPSAAAPPQDDLDALGEEALSSDDAAVSDTADENCRKKLRRGLRSRGKSGATLPPQQKQETSAESPEQPSPDDGPLLDPPLPPQQQASSFYSKPRQKATPPPSPHAAADPTPIKDQLSDFSEDPATKNEESQRQGRVRNGDPSAPSQDDLHAPSSPVEHNGSIQPKKPPHQKQKKPGTKRSYKSHLFGYDDHIQQSLANCSDGSPEFRSDALRDDISIRCTHRGRSVRPPSYYGDYHNIHDDLDNASNTHSLGPDFSHNLDIDPLLDVKYTQDNNIDDYSYDNNTSDWEYVSDIRSTLASCLKTANAHMLLIAKRNKRRSYRRLLHAQYSPPYRTYGGYLSSKKFGHGKNYQRYGKYSQYAPGTPAKNRTSKKLSTKASPRTRSKKRKERKSTRGSSSHYEQLDSSTRAFEKRNSSPSLGYGAQVKCNPDGTKKVCEYCKATETPMWRRGPSGCGTLCNKCGVKWRSGKILEPILGSSNPPSPAVLLKSEESPDITSDIPQTSSQVSHEQKTPSNGDDDKDNAEVSEDDGNVERDEDTTIENHVNGIPALPDTVEDNDDTDVKSVSHSDTPEEASPVSQTLTPDPVNGNRAATESDSAELSSLPVKECNDKDETSVPNGSSPPKDEKGDAPSDNVVSEEQDAPKHPTPHVKNPDLQGKIADATQEYTKITYEQKKELSVLITQLSDENMYQAAEMIRSKLPHLRDIYEDIELDIDAVDDNVLSALYDFVKNLTASTPDNNTSLQKKVPDAVANSLSPQSSMLPQNGNEDAARRNTMALSASE